MITRVQSLIEHAITSRASDIHLEPTDSCLRVRFRIDGLLHDQESFDFSLLNQIISRIKVLSSINIAEKRIPQDGKFSDQFHNRIIDFRVSTFPSLYGEKVVIRILDRNAQAVSLDELGFYDEMAESFKQLILRPHGFFLVTGPTGSGKTTTLYAALAALHRAEKNIATLEDPVEYHINGITQGHINPEAGFTFEKGIRALLRQDPDILLIGEIRDRQTAKIAIEAALTGHLVLSTLHTNDAPSAIMRLIDMGVEPFLINAALTGVLAQRLARTICVECKYTYSPNDHEKELLNTAQAQVTELATGAGCIHCEYRKYKGRTGIFELLPISNVLRRMIVQDPHIDALRIQSQKEGVTALFQDGLAKVKQGIIGLDELVRVAL
jgi:type IV pilus assembly protein PilB